VIVVIAILAAITIVSYNGITARANTSSAESSAAAVAKKAEAWAADTGSYPATFSALTNAGANTAYSVTSTVAILDGTVLSTSNLPSAPRQINFYKCGHSGSTTNPTTTAAITNQTGVRILNWNYSSNTVDTTNLGVTSGNAGPSNNWPINCVISAT
jgi:type II secretory pathway pseudopilin PulG